MVNGQRSKVSSSRQDGARAHRAWTLEVGRLHSCNTNRRGTSWDLNNLITQLFCSDQMLHLQF